jgi:polysaccharide export outer membrane protein
MTHISGKIDRRLSPCAIIAGALLAQAGAPSAWAGTEPARTAAAQPALPSSGTVDAQYKIGPDDTLEVIVFQVPELTRVVQVDATGQFSLPLAGRIMAAGLTTAELEKALTDKLAGRYLNEPVITVLVKQAVSQRVTVDGAVMKPGVYNLTGPTSLVQALALANGPDPRVANLRKVAIFRTIDGQRKGQIFDLGKIRDGRAPDPRVQPNDIIIVDASGTRSFFTYFGSSLPILSIFSRY